MKISSYLIALLATSMLFACNTVDKFTQFNLDYSTEVTIPATTLIDLPIDLITPDIESNSESEFAVNDTRKDLIEEITLEQLTLEVTAPAGTDFSFLESISIHLSAADLPEIELAALNPVPTTAGSLIELSTPDIDLKEYIKKDNFNIRVNTVTDEALTNEVKINVFTLFFIDAKILGV